MADTDQVADTEQWIRIATALARAMMGEMILWASTSPVRFTQYDRLRKAIFQKILEEAAIDEETRALIAERPPWKSSEVEAAQAIKKMEELYSDPEILKAMKRAIEKMAEDEEGTP